MKTFLTRSVLRVLCIWVIFAGLTSNTYAQSDLIISVNNIAMHGELELRGLVAAYPYPILTTISVVDTQANLVTGLADPVRWLGTEETAENGQLVGDIWYPLVEHLLDDSTRPDDPDIYHQFASPLFTEVRRTDPLPTSTMLIMDVSNSMDEELADAKAGLRAYVNLLRPIDRCGIIQFADSIISVLPMTSDTTELNRNINAAALSGNTALYDAMKLGVDEIRKEGGRRCIIVYTDGKDNRSDTEPEEVIECARLCNLPIYTIALGNDTEEDTLKKVARMTGGIFFKAATAQEMKIIYTKFADLVQNYYVMAHASPDPYYNETWRVVNVTTRPELLEGQGQGFYYIGDFPKPFATDLALELEARTANQLIEAGDTLNIVQPGEIYDYFLDIGNLGPNDADTVRLFHIIPDSVAFLRAEPEPFSRIGKMLFWQLEGPTLQEDLKIKVTVHLAENLPDELKAIVSEAKIFASMDSIWTNNYDTDTVYVREIEPSPPQNYDLILDQIALTDTSVQIGSEEQPAVLAGNQYSYQLQIKNHGPGGAKNVVVWDVFPDSVRVTDFKPLPARQNADSVFWNIDSLAVNDSLEIMMDVTVVDSIPFAPFPLLNLSGLVAENDTSAQNDTSSTVVYALERRREGPSKNYNLKISQVVFTDTTILFNDSTFSAVVSGDTARYKLFVFNDGPNTAHDFMIWDIFPDSMQPGDFNLPPTSTTVDTLFWQIDSLTRGDSLKISFQALLVDSLPFTPFPLINESGIIAEFDTVAEDNQARTTVYGIQLTELPELTDIAVHQTVQTDSFEVVGPDTMKYVREGETYFYTIYVTNVSPVPALKVTILDLLPDSVQVGDFQPAPSAIFTDSLIWEVSELPPTESFRIQFSATVVSKMPIGISFLVNKVSVGAENEDPGKLDNNTTIDTVYNINRLPDWEPLIEATPGLVEVGGDVTVRVQVPVPVKEWDVWVHLPTGQIDSLYADPFISRTTLTPEEWVELDPQYPVRQKYTEDNEEPLQFELRVTDFFDDFKQARASVTVVSGEGLEIDRNVFMPGEEGPISINFRIKQAGEARLEVYDITGTRITKIIESEFAAGWNSYQWDGLTENGQKIGSGFYILTLRSNGYHAWKKLMIVR